MLVLLVMVLGVILVQGSQPVLGAPEATITMTSPNNLTVFESDDYATQQLGDPWDMNNLDDIDYLYRFGVPNVGNGVWSATTQAGDAHFMLQYQGFDIVYNGVGEKSGANYPIDTNRYTRLHVRMYSDRQTGTRVFWFRKNERTPAGASDIFTLYPGWNIYSFDLTVPYGNETNNWRQLGSVAGLRFDAPWGASNSNVQVDWARLTPNNGNLIEAKWSYSGGNDQASIYLSTSPTPGQADELLLGTTAASNGSFRWLTTGIAPGTYYIHAKLGGPGPTTTSSGPLIIAPAPLARLDAPSPVSGEDFAYARFGYGWDGGNPGQFQRLENVTPPSYNGEYMQSSATNNDPNVYWLFNDAAREIDTSRYRYMSIRAYYQAPAGNPTAPFNAGPRVTWARSTPMEWQQTRHMAIQYYRWVPMTFDLATVPLEPGASSYGWSGTQRSFRFDVHEEDGGSPGNWSLPQYFRISQAHLTGNPIANNGTLIRWTPLQGSGVVDLFFDGNNSGFDGSQIATNVPLGNGSYSWNTSTLPNGTYWVYIVARNGPASTRFYSLVPLVVNHSSPSTIFSDVPTNFWAVNDVNALALRNIIAGYPQADGSVLFRPGANTTRQQLSKMVVLAAGWPLSVTGGQTFTDVPPSNTFYPYIQVAAQRGVISGYTCGGPGEPCDGQGRKYFRPARNVSRAQTAKMLSVAAGWQPVTGRQTFRDVPPSSELNPYVEAAAQHGVISGYPCGAPGEPCPGNYFRPNADVTRAQLSKMIAGSFSLAASPVEAPSEAPSKP